MSECCVWPFIIIGIIVFLIWTEDGSQNCHGKWCNNTPEFITPTDTTRKIIDKIRDMVRINHTVVGWRRALLVSIFCAMFILLLFQKSFPSGIQVFIVTILIFIPVYMSCTWFVEHWWKMNDYQIESSLLQLRSMLSSTTS